MYRITKETLEYIKQNKDIFEKQLAGDDGETIRDRRRFLYVYNGWWQSPEVANIPVFVKETTAKFCINRVEVDGDNIAIVNSRGETL